MENNIDIGFNGYAVIQDNGVVRVSNTISGNTVPFDYESARNLTKLFKEQGWLDDPEYELVEVAEFDQLMVGDVLDRTGEVVTEVEGGRARLCNEIELHKRDFDRFGPLNVRRSKKPITGTLIINDPGGRTSFWSSGNVNGKADAECHLSEVLAPGKYKVTVEKRR